MNVQIANPIYDVVFKYMMEDNAVAKLLLSSIIRSEIISLEPKQQEYTKTKVTPTPEKDLTVYRLDFSAKIETAEGPKLIMIELQKATYPDDIMRFRGYLGAQYSRSDNVAKIKIETKKKDKIATLEKNIPLQIYCLYFLGEDVGIAGVPVIEVNHVAHDVSSNEVINTRNKFIEALHHRSWIVQVNWLKEPRRTELEQLLSIFDQENRSSDFHFLNVCEEEFPEKYRPLIRRLKMAASSPEIKRQMQDEDVYLDYIRNSIREGVEAKTEEYINALTEKDNTIAEQGNTIAEQGNTIAEQNAVLEKYKAMLQQAGITVK
jgi:hypothetical protein